MKPIKKLGLATLAALMAMAFVGISSAMAETTSLCTGDGSGCGVTHVHETSVSKAKLLTSFLTVECDVLFLGDALSGIANPLVIHGNFTYTNCGSCTATEESGPVEIKVLKLGHETADVTGEGLVHVECGGSLNCSYNGVGLKGTGKGPLLSIQFNGEVSISTQAVSKETGGFLCPSTAKLDINTTPLSATYIGSEGGGGGGSAMACIELDSNTGLYSKANSSDPTTSCESDDNSGNGRFELVQIYNSEYVLGKKVCAFTTGKGLFLWFKSKTCENDQPGTGKWVLGIVAT